MATCPYCAEEIPRTATVCPHCDSELEARPRTRKAKGKAPAKQASSSATIWIIVLSVVLVMGLGCVGVLTALLLPAVQQAREAARRSQSKNNLRQIGLAMHNYHDTHRVFPPGGIVDETGREYHSWMTMLLPYMEQSPLYNRIDFNEPWDATSNSFNFQVEVPAYLNPAVSEKTDAAGFALSHYAGNSKAMGPNSSLSLREITDGTSNTMLCGEVAGNFRPWGDPSNVRDPALGINKSPDGFGSPFRGGANILLMDGAVRFVSDDIDPSVLEALATPDGGEQVFDF